MSVEIVGGSRTEKKWGMHEIADTATLAKLHCGFADGNVDSGSSFQLPIKLKAQPFQCTIGKKREGPLSRLS